jgi:hypothetical protein
VTITQETIDTPAHDDIEALFPEARRRRRRIRLVVGVSILAFALVAAGVVYGVNSGSASPTPSPSAPSLSGPSEILAGPVVRATLAAGSARESWRTVTSYPGCSPPVSGSGSLDLVQQRSSVTVSSPGCHSLGEKYSGHGTYRTIQIGSVVYQTRQPQEVWDYGPGKSWLATPNYSVAALASADPLSILKAVSGPFMKVGASYIRGVPTTEYVDSASLASVQTATGNANAGPIGIADPPLKQIPVVVNIWVDAHHKVRQISTWEPYYTQNYTNGASSGGAYIVQSPTPTPDAPPRQQGFVQTTLDLWQFGATEHIAPPPAAAVATPH